MCIRDSLYSEIIDRACNNIATTWPEMADYITSYVKVVCFLPNASFRSCSAERYNRVTFFGNMDEHILDIEENLVHETGHQILYCLSEVTDITVENTPRLPSYTLPWSGTKRDLFGYFHAFYIYVLLTKYFAKRAGQNSKYEQLAKIRAEGLIAGNQIAADELLNNEQLTEQAKAIIKALLSDMGSIDLGDMEGPT